MSKLRELLGRATKGKLVAEVGNEGIEKKALLYIEGSYTVATVWGGGKKMNAEVEANSAKIEYLWNNAEAIATLIEAAEDVARGSLQGPEDFEQYAKTKLRAALAEIEK
jgi:hypothetical protein